MSFANNQENSTQKNQVEEIPNNIMSMINDVIEEDETKKTEERKIQFSLQDEVLDQFESEFDTAEYASSGDSGLFEGEEGKKGLMSNMLSGSSKKGSNKLLGKNSFIDNLAATNLGNSNHVRGNKKFSTQMGETPMAAMARMDKNKIVQPKAYNSQNQLNMYTKQYFENFGIVNQKNNKKESFNAEQSLMLTQFNNGNINQLNQMNQMNQLNVNGNINMNMNNNSCLNNLNNNLCGMNMNMLNQSNNLNNLNNLNMNFNNNMNNMNGITNSPIRNQLSNSNLMQLNNSPSSLTSISIQNQNQLNQLTQLNQIPPQVSLSNNYNSMSNQQLDTPAMIIERLLSKQGCFTFEIYNYLKGKFIGLITAQQTSRLCQQYIEHTQPEIIHMIFSEIVTKLPMLLVDPYANYFCLKIFYFLSSNDRYLFLQSISSCIYTLGINKIATYPIQCIVEHLNNINEKVLLVNSVQPYLIKMSTDLYAAHILEKIIKFFEYEIAKPVIKFAVNNLLFLANNANGLCIIKKLLEAEYRRDYFEQLKSEIYKNSLLLVQNPYGNYALQICVEKWDLNELCPLMNSFFGKFIILSIQKYSSNVIERCIEKSSLFLNGFIKEICGGNNSNSNMNIMLKNSFSNYVLITALKAADSIQRNILYNYISSNLAFVNDSKIISKWRQILENTNTVKNINVMDKMNNNVNINLNNNYINNDINTLQFN